ncbi:DegQ family serine endoprotease [Methylophaga sp. OBS4]|uniref:DegQ family serine endoprotease n=1 Tax=Methylophaga sp. OBS4 TaxID=2991935 RepID=UPI002256BC10|nr:DegQ family serine endoprotease [Methylophaga sp. OBS4]MCX4186621.1 DegQ family serine endoprotease [Methylophaga sp. OBS4]
MKFSFKSFLLWLAGFSLVMQVATGALPLDWFDGQDQMPTLAPMLDRSKPAVVNIATRSHVRVQDNPLLNDPFFRHFFNLPEQPRVRPRQSLGSGVIFDAKQGLVLTNNHVIRGADEITVSLHDGRSFQAEIVGSDAATDVALIKIPAEKLTALPLADSDTLRVGDFVVAIGNPFGLGQTVTSGIVSALGRSGLGIEGYENFIQTDASINPGNSGGALVNLRGELVGINTAIFSPGQSAGNIGIGFAIPSNLVKQISDQLLEHGEVRRAYLGVQMQDITPELAEAFGIEAQQGAVVTQVVENSAAAEAGLQVGDVVTAVDGVPLLNADSLRNTIGLMVVGQTVKLDIVRDGKTKTLKAKVKQTQQTEPNGTVHPRLSGATFGDIEEGSPYFGRVEGVMVYSIKRGSPAWKAGLRAEDIITSVNRKPVASLEQFKPLVHDADELLLNIVRGQRAMFLLLR